MYLFISLNVSCHWSSPFQSSVEVMQVQLQELVRILAQTPSPDRTCLKQTGEQAR